ncbi:MAG: hypothetical protein ACXU68_00735 [Croceibacterium sp.]
MIRLLRFAFWAAVLIAFTMAVLPHPPQVPVWDKLQHMAAFFVITVLGRAAYHEVSRKILLPALIGFGGLIELVQMVPALHRDSDWHDLLADIVAVVGALAIASLLERFRTAPTD